MSEFTVTYVINLDNAPGQRDDTKPPAGESLQLPAPQDGATPPLGGSFQSTFLQDDAIAPADESSQSTATQDNATPSLGRTVRSPALQDDTTLSLGSPPSSSDGSSQTLTHQDESKVSAGWPSLRDDARPSACETSQTPAPQDDATSPTESSPKTQATPRPIICRPSQLLTRKDSSVVSSITFHDLRYNVTERKYFKKLSNKTILNSVSGEMKTGVNAIMGPTGSGKTTLLDLLADRKDKSGKSGKVLINGAKRQSNYRSVVGYVVQDDVVMGTLSVRENLQFSAALRLPDHMTRAQREERVERVIETLGLYRCAETKVGTCFFRGVSCGERKRTNIGMELIIEPQVLFLDEPTTGLDAHTAVSVVSLLKDLSLNEKRLIVLSIHQPRYSIFKLFDSLTLLSQGAMVYHGPANKALSYFDRLGFTCEEHENPADFFLDTIKHCEKQHHVSREETVFFANLDQEESADVRMIKNSANSEKFNIVKSYQKSKEYQELRKAIDPVLINLHEEKKIEKMFTRVVKQVFNRELYATSFFWQLLIVTIRSAKNMLRCPIVSIYQFFYQTILAVIIGLIYWQLDTEPNRFTDRIGVFFFIVANQSFGSLGAIELFIMQKALFIHENASGYYRVSAFFLSKIFTDLIPLRFLPNVLFAVIIYFMIGLQVEADKFFIFWLILMLVNICAVSVAFFISAGVRNGEIANLLIILPFTFSLLFAGLLISLDSLPVWIAWLRHFSFMKYGIEAFSINEMDGLRFRGPCQMELMFSEMDDECRNISMPLFADNKHCISDCAFDGLAQLNQLGYENTTEALWWDVCALILYSSIFLILSYIVLRSIKKEK